MFNSNNIIKFSDLSKHYDKWLADTSLLASMDTETVLNNVLLDSDVCKRIIVDTDSALVKLLTLFDQKNEDKIKIDDDILYIEFPREVKINNRINKIIFKTPNTIADIVFQPIYIVFPFNNKTLFSLPLRLYKSYIDELLELTNENGEIDTNKILEALMKESKINLKFELKEFRMKLVMREMEDINDILNEHCEPIEVNITGNFTGEYTIFKFHSVKFKCKKSFIQKLHNSLKRLKDLDNNIAFHTFARFSIKFINNTNNNNIETVYTNDLNILEPLIKYASNKITIVSDDNNNANNLKNVEFLSIVDDMFKTVIKNYFGNLDKQIHAKITRYDEDTSAIIQTISFRNIDGIIFETYTAIDVK